MFESRAEDIVVVVCEGVRNIKIHVLSRTFAVKHLNIHNLWSKRKYDLEHIKQINSIYEDLVYCFLGYTGLTVGLEKEFNTFYILVRNMTLLITTYSEKLPADTGLR